MTPFLVFCFLIAAASAQFCGESYAKKNCVTRCQDPNNATVLPKAYYCNDIIDNCHMLFNCNNDTMPCWYNGPNSTVVPKDPRTFPKVRPAACDDPAKKDQALLCALTCGICCETPSYLCFDDKTIDCKGNQQKCNDSSWYDVMHLYCPLTCNLCDPYCSDVNQGCDKLKTLCTNPGLKDWMASRCAKTCGAC
uniref:ShKT domain-containing protein n=1 Tax=Panagrolaimus sp. JU765 TaxID=591449 RepID=A0AC34R4Q6_9BILA